ncbi:acetylornithine deacetylase/succinyl-diaminopimelate desuccinylase-like protein [Brevibacterium paucivorans]|uniref:Acetylornithine deacetylase/succinyl-diaminopimelate desuccinylase-like protein n=1 Tax=Brevibacterium paucivorans TaxID=170994 RepID=A0ABS2SK47_9MICO|nr:M20/M25/M40 family metallo-hydrolase [Brevibacterium paucivorans]MBM7815426.1 acetylornithine deacetylase/succinyl-diaminopimelate desuccinylase-like protein [Brevibacterium paucivorans]
MSALDKVCDEAASEVVQLCQDLIRFDTQNWGEGKANPERIAADYIAEKLAEVGVESQIFESAPGRANLFARIPGKNPDRPALVVHGHTDVVPADASEWSVDPFEAVIKDGCVWGRGAVDMKDMDAMIVAGVRALVRNNVQPDRDLIIAFFADEEAGSTYGSHWVVKNHPEVFEGASEAISEVGGYSVDIRGQRAYLVQTAEKGMEWVRLTAHGNAGHGSQINNDNPVVKLAAAVARIGEHEWPTEPPAATRELLAGVSELTGIENTEANRDKLLAELGSALKFVGATFKTTANPTALDAGYKHNVIPGQASALIDCRPLPGRNEDALLTLKELAGPDVVVEQVISGVSLETPFEGDLVDRMKEAVEAEDPGATVLPYTLSGGTDNKALSELGITGYGFAPLKLTGDLDFPAMFHGVDERVPLEALDFGARTLVRFMVSA